MRLDNSPSSRSDNFGTYARLERPSRDDNLICGHDPVAVELEAEAPLSRSSSLTLALTYRQLERSGVSLDICDHFIRVAPPSRSPGNGIPGREL